MLGGDSSAMTSSTQPPSVSTSSTASADLLLVPKKAGKRAREIDYLLDWSRGRDMTSWAEAKVSAAREARRLQQKRVREDERRSVKLFSSLDVDERGDFFDELGRDDLVFRKLRDSPSCAGEEVDEVNMDEL
jgi:hypothetical protein